VSPNCRHASQLLQREHEPSVMPDLPTSPFIMSNDVLDRHCNHFHELFNEHLIGKDHTVQSMTEDAYNERFTFLKMLKVGAPV
jgi:hypothetical protein